MTRRNSALLRLAVSIRDRFVAGRNREPDCDLPKTTWECAAALTRRIQRAAELNCGLAQRRLQHDLAEVLLELQQALAAKADQLRSCRGNDPAPSACDLHEDLLALYEEFDSVSFSRRDRTLSVTTEPIELEGIGLGPFEIRLNWDDLSAGHRGEYRVIALTPHPAAANESVTHPHVQDEALCEGDGQMPIRRALADGRLLDFFQIVAGILRTYNSGSPHIALADWYGIECHDCGTSVGEDDSWSCEGCGSRICSECYFSCTGCDGILCTECVTCCEGCDMHVCPSCFRTCTRCDEELCRGCLDTQERCETCHEKEAELEEKQAERNEAIAEKVDDGYGAGPAVQPDCVGQTAVSTR